MPEGDDTPPWEEFLHRPLVCCQLCYPLSSPVMDAACNSQPDAPAAAPPVDEEASKAKAAKDAEKEAQIKAPTHLSLTKHT